MSCQTKICGCGLDIYWAAPEQHRRECPESLYSRRKEMELTEEQLRKGCSKLIEALPTYALAEDLMIEAARAAVDIPTWIHAEPEDRLDIQRQLYRALKEVFDVSDIDAKLIREDVQRVRAIKDKLDYILQDENYSETVQSMEEILGECLYHIEQILKDSVEPEPDEL